MIHTAALYVPQPNEILAIRGSVDSKTVGWAANVFRFSWMPGQPYEFQLQARIIGADFETGLDSRLHNQKLSIERMSEHLNHHCPALRYASGACDWNGRD